MKTLALRWAKSLLFVGCLLILCSGANERRSNACDENPAFKQEFFHHIDVVEKYSIERLTGADEYTISPEVFLHSLDFISAYTKVSMGEVLNYEVGYPNLEMFRKDKKKWLNWYKANRCKNVKMIK